NVAPSAASVAPSSWLGRVPAETTAPGTVTAPLADPIPATFAPWVADAMSVAASDASIVSAASRDRPQAGHAVAPATTETPQWPQTMGGRIRWRLSPTLGSPPRSNPRESPSFSMVALHVQLSQRCDTPQLQKRSGERLTPLSSNRRRVPGLLLQETG